MVDSFVLFQGIRTSDFSGGCPDPLSPLWIRAYLTVHDNKNNIHSWDLHVDI